jgi:hypothetical protein
VGLINKAEEESTPGSLCLPKEESPGGVPLSAKCSSYFILADSMLREHLKVLPFLG